MTIESSSACADREKEVKEKEEEEEIAMTIEKIRASLDFLNDQDQDDYHQETSTNETNKFDCLKSLTSVTENELSSTGFCNMMQQQHDEQQQQQQQKKRMEQYLLENYSANDEIPRQNSPGFYFS